MTCLYRISVLGLCFLCFFSSGFAQSGQINCGTDLLHNARIQTDTTYRNFVRRIKQQLADTPPDKAFDGTTYTIPVVFVVYHLGEAVGTGSNVSDAALQAQITLMNQMYAGQSATYPGTRANIQFTLARRTPDCHPFNGILRLDGRSVANYQTTGADGGTIDNGLRQLAGQFSTSSAENFVVVRVVHKIASSGVAGYAYFGGDMFVNANGMSSAGAYNNLLSHEMGHVLFLYHTFEGSVTSSGSFTCPANGNPASDGDAVADTDPHKQNEPNNCFYQATPQSITTANACNAGQPFGWIANNVMAYGCYPNRFTQGQIDRMRLFLTTDNRVLGLSNFGTAPSAADALTPATCSVAASTGNASGYSAGIVRFRFGGQIDKSSDFYPYYTGFYQNYACTDRAVVTAGSSYTFAITAYTFPQSNYRRVYIDYDNNGTFDETTELAFVSASNGNTGSITIPTTATRNVYLRMRVVINNGTVTPSACQITGSPTYGYGEIEDYGLLVQGAACTGATATLAGSQTVASGQSVLLTASLTGTSPWNLTFSTGQVVSNITTSPYIFTVTPGSSTTYTLTRVSNACGNGTVSGSAAVTVIQPCLAPTSFNPSLVGPNSATVSWGAVAGSVGYAMRYRTLGSTTWSLQSTGSTSSVIASLSMNQAIEWQVQTLCAGGVTSSFSASQTLVTTCLPVSGVLSGGQSISLGQAASLTATLTGGNPTTPLYSFTVSNGQSFSNVTSPYVFTVSPTSSTTYAISRVSNGCRSETGTGSAVVTVIQPVCNAPASINLALTSPNAATLSWGAVSGAVSYRVQIRPFGSGVWSSSFATAATTLSTNSWAMGGIYEYQIQTLCANGLTSAFSASQYFQTTCLTPTATLTGSQTILAGGVASLTATFSGGNPLNPLYSFTLSTGQTFVNVSSLFSVTVAPGSSTSYWISRVSNGCSTNSGSGTAIVTVTQPCLAPVSFSAAVVGPNSATVSWGAVAGSVGYAMRYRTVGSTTWSLQSTGSTSSVIASLSMNQAIEWQVQTLCAGGVTSDFSASQTLVTTCLTTTATIVGTQTVIVGQPASFSVYVTGGNPANPLYSLTIANGPTYLNIPIASSPFVFTVIYSASRTLTVLSVSNGCATVPGSGSAALTVVIPVCTTPIPTSVVATSPSTATVSWSAIPDTQFGYNVRYRAVGNPMWFQVNVTSTSAVIGSWPMGTLVEWQVQGFCSGANYSAFTDSQTLVTTCLPVSATLTGNQSISLGQVASLTASFTGGNPNNPLYSFTVSNGQSFSNVTSPYVFTVSPTSSTTYTISRVSNGCRTESGTGSAVVTVIQPCASPVNLVAQGLVDRALLSWSAVNGVGYYNLQWRLLGGTSWTTISGILTAGYTLTGLSPSTAYEYQVMSQCVSGSSSFYAPPRSFTTLCNLPSAVLTGSQSITADQVASLTINLTGASPWSVSLSNGSGQTVLSVLSSPFVFTLTPSNSTTYALAGVSNSCGVGQAVGTASVTVIQPCLAPVSFSATVVGPNSATVSWGAVAGSVGYAMRYRTLGSTTWSLQSTGGTSSVIASLSMNQAIEWQVQTLCVGGVTSDFSASQTLVTTCLPVSATLTGNQSISLGQVASLMASFTGGNPNNPLYSFTVSNGQSFSNVSSPYVFTVSPTSSTTYTIIQVSNGCRSETGTGSATVTVIQPCFAPTDLTATPSVAMASLAWSAVSGVTQYTLQTRPLGATLWNTIASLTTTAYSLTGLSPQTAYEFQVQAQCSGGVSSSYSSPRSFTTLCQLPSATLIGSKTITIGQVTALTVTLTGGTSPWSVTLSDGQSFTNLTGSVLVVTVWPTSSTAYTLSGVSNDGCGVGTASGTAVVTVTPCPPVTNLLPAIAGVNTVTLSWGAVPGAQDYQIQVRPQGATIWSVDYPVTSTTAVVVGWWMTMGRGFEYQITTRCTNVVQAPPSALQSYTTVCLPVSATLSGSQSISLGQVASLSVGLSGGDPAYPLYSFTVSNGQSFSNVFNPHSFTVSPTASTTYTITRVSNGCQSELGTGTAEIAVIQPCLIMYTLRDGLWTDPTVWSCGRVPLNTDPVDIGHQITVPAGEARAQQVRYTTGQLIFNEGSRLILGQ